VNTDFLCDKDTMMALCSGVTIPCMILRISRFLDSRPSHYTQQKHTIQWVTGCIHPQVIRWVRTSLMRDSQSYSPSLDQSVRPNSVSTFSVLKKGWWSKNTQLEFLHTKTQFVII
jgi:hypothetical protein